MSSDLTHKHYLRQLVRNARDVSPVRVNELTLNAVEFHQAEAVIWASEQLERLEKRNARLQEAIVNALEGEVFDECGNREDDGIERKYGNVDKAVAILRKAVEVEVVK